MQIKKFNELTNYEIYNILKIRIDVFNIEQNFNYQDLDGKDFFSYHLFLKDDDDNIIAYLRILEKGQSFDEISIGRVCIHKNFRNKGLCKKMIAHAIDFINNNLNESKITISAQAYLQELYKSFSFISISDIYIKAGVEHIDMTII